MSAEYHNDPPVDFLVASSSVPLTELATRRQEASRARRHAAAIGDYVAAERWYRQERTIDAQLDAREQREEQAPQ